MRVLSFVSIFLIPGILFIRHNGNAKSDLKPKMEVTCVYPNGKSVESPDKDGRCYGYNPCTACKNCSSCNYCNSGGSCGMCSSGQKSNQSTSARSSASHSNGSNSTRGRNNSSSFYNSNTSPEIRTIYLPATAIVSAETLNVRKGPGMEFEVVARLSAGDFVTVTEKAGEKWVKIEVMIWNDGETVMVEGYVFKEYLLF